MNFRPHRIVVLALLLAGMRLQAQEPNPRPHIVFVLADDLGLGDIGCYGGKLAPTPHIDRMAQEGLSFTQFYAAAPICSPSRVGFTTGMFPAQWNIVSYLHSRAGNRACGQADFLDPRAPSLARALQSAGYATAHIGKWHMGGGRDVTNAPPFAAYGFDEHVGTYESPQPHPDITATHWIWSPQDKVPRWERTAFFVDKTLDFIRRHRDRPCYVNLWMDDTHTPWIPGSDAQEGETPANLRRVLIEMDRQLGRLMDALPANTLLIFTGDNGALPTFGGARNGYLRGCKLSLYEGGLREPFIVRWPGHIPAGIRDERTVMNAVDLFPSLCAIAGAPLPVDIAWAGENMREALLGQPVMRTKPMLWEYGRNEHSFAYPRGRDRSPNVAIRDGRWKLLVNSDGHNVELYDLQTDAQETANVSAAHPEITARLVKQALAWRRSLPEIRATNH